MKYSILILIFSIVNLLNAQSKIDSSTFVNGRTKYKFSLIKHESNNSVLEFDSIKSQYGLTGVNKLNSWAHRYRRGSDNQRYRNSNAELNGLYSKLKDEQDSACIYLFEIEVLKEDQMVIGEQKILYVERSGKEKVFDLYKLSGLSELEVQDIRLKDSFIYFNLACTSYSKEVKGKCSYLYCLNAKSGKLEWVSQNLVSNNIFIIEGDFLVCSYGFTSEDDYLYLLNRKTGQVYDKILIKKAIDYFEFKGGELFTIDYNRSVHIYKLKQVNE